MHERNNEHGHKLVCGESRVTPLFNILATLPGDSFMIWLLWCTVMLGITYKKKIGQKRYKLRCNVYLHHQLLHNQLMR